jgi:hypothetical protein
MYLSPAPKHYSNVGGRMKDVSYDIVCCTCKSDDGDDYAIQFEFFLSWTIVLVYGAFITMILFMTRNHRMVKITLPVLSNSTIFGGVFVCIHVYLNTTPLNDSTYRVAVRWRSK